MCQSKAQGGQRCFSHQCPAAAKAVQSGDRDRARNATRALALTTTVAEKLQETGTQTAAEARAQRAVLLKEVARLEAIIAHAPELQRRQDATKTRPQRVHVAPKRERRLSANPHPGTSHGALPYPKTKEERAQEEAVTEARVRAYAYKVEAEWKAEQWIRERPMNDRVKFPEALRNDPRFTEERIQYPSEHGALIRSAALTRPQLQHIISTTRDQKVYFQGTAVLAEELGWTTKRTRQKYVSVDVREARKARRKRRLGAFVQFLTGSDSKKKSTNKGGSTAFQRKGVTA